MKLTVCSYFLIIILVIVECYMKKRKTGSVDYENGIRGRGPCKLWCGPVSGPGGLNGCECFFEGCTSFCIYKITNIN